VNGVDAALAGTDNVEVSVENLEGIGAYLDVVVSAIRDNLRPMTYEAHRLARTGGDGSQSALGGPTFSEAQDLAMRAAGTFQAVDTSLRAVADELERVARGIRQMAENYRTTEERNALTMADFTRAVSGG
jgi:uncharacterized protein YukE